MDRLIFYLWVPPHSLFKFTYTKKTRSKTGSRFFSSQHMNVSVIMFGWISPFPVFKIDSKTPREGERMQTRGCSNMPARSDKLLLWTVGGCPRQGQPPFARAHRVLFSRSQTGAPRAWSGASDKHSSLRLPQPLSALPAGSWTDYNRPLVKYSQTSVTR